MDSLKEKPQIKSPPLQNPTVVLEDNGAVSFLGKSLDYPKTVKLYIKEAVDITGTSLNHKNRQYKVTVNKFCIGSSTDKVFLENGGNEELKLLFKDERTRISFVALNEIGEKHEYHPPIKWGERFINWITQGTDNCVKSKDDKNKSVTCCEFSDFLHNGQTEINPNITIKNTCKIRDIKSIQPFSYLALIDTDNSKHIHSMTYLGAGFCIGKMGPGDIIIQTVENSRSFWAAKGVDVPKSLGVFTGHLES